MNRAKETQMKPQYFEEMYAKPGDVVRCIGWHGLGSWRDGKDYVVQSDSCIIDEDGERRPTTGARFIFTSRASDTPLALKNMMPDQAGPIMEAFRQGNPVQAWNNGAWNIYRGEGLKPGGMYRLPPKPVATMNWTGIHPDITHVAGDEDGMVWLCEGEPSPRKDGWGGVTYMWRLDPILSPCPFQTNGADWKDTLIERPKEGGE